MRCPKCRHIGFDTSERCRNCGYDFSLTRDRSATDDLLLRGENEPYGPLADFSLGNVAPKAPLSVRRATPEAARPRSPSVRTGSHEPRLSFEPATEEASDRADARAATAEVARSEAAGARSRIGAALVDASLLAAIDATVIYFTLRLCNLTVATLGLLPVMPLAAFFCLLNGGYLVLFTTAGGQTIGKMAAGIRVVGARRPAVPPGSAVLRTAAYLVSALPVGLGFLAGLLGRERRALHDRLARTRVVRVS